MTEKQTAIQPLCVYVFIFNQACLLHLKPFSAQHTKYKMELQSTTERLDPYVNQTPNSSMPSTMLPLSVLSNLPAKTLFSKPFL